MTWQPGRQGTGYWKWKLWSFWRTDAYILRYPEGSSVPWHLDSVPGRRHFRLNVVLRRARDGGHMGYSGRVRCWLGRVYAFRPDTVPHRIAFIHEGERWVLSFGLAV